MKLSLECLEARVVPSAPTYHGGPVLQNPAVSTAFIGGYNQQFDSALSVAAGDYTRILGVFGVQSASRDGTVTLPSPGTLTNAQLGDYLTQQINAGVLPQPSPNQLYFLCIAQSSMPDVPNAGAYHSYFYYNGQAYPYAVVFTVGPNAGTYGVFHEYAEAVTDPLVNAWYGNGIDDEVADAAGGDTFSLDGFNTAAAVISPDGSLVTGPTPFTPIGSSLPPLTSTPSPSVFFGLPTFDFNSILSAWLSGVEQLVDEIFAAETTLFQQEMQWLSGLHLPLGLEQPHS